MKRITGRKPNKKKERTDKKNIKLIIVSIIAILIIVLMAIRLLPTVRKIEVVINTSNGNYITKEQIITLSGVKVGDKLYKDLRSTIRQRIEENPYIKSVDIERNLSGTIKIKVSQRNPEYLINYAGEYIYLDKEGYVLEVSSTNNEKTIIIGFSTDFSGLSIGKTKIRLNQSDLEKLDVINNVLFNFKNNQIENKVNSIDIGDKKNIILQLDDGKEVHLGDGSDINTRVLYMKQILEAEAEHTGIIYINSDLDEGYVYFKEQ